MKCINFRPAFKWQIPGCEALWNWLSCNATSEQASLGGSWSCPKQSWNKNDEYLSSLWTIFVLHTHIHLEQHLVKKWELNEPDINTRTIWLSLSPTMDHINYGTAGKMYCALVRVLISSSAWVVLYWHWVLVQTFTVRAAGKDAWLLSLLASIICILFKSPQQQNRTLSQINGSLLTGNVNAKMNLKMLIFQATWIAWQHFITAMLFTPSPAHGLKSYCNKHQPISYTQHRLFVFNLNIKKLIYKMAESCLA